MPESTRARADAGDRRGEVRGVGEPLSRPAVPLRRPAWATGALSEARRQKYMCHRLRPSAVQAWKTAKFDPNPGVNKPQ